MATSIESRVDVNPTKLTKRYLLVAPIVVGMSGLSIVMSLILPEVMPYQSHLRREQPSKSHSELYQEVSIKADLNHDGATTQEEWMEVYRALGVHFDAYTSNPAKDLSSEQLNFYLER